MATTANMHGADYAEAHSSGGTAWVSVHSKDGDVFTMFVPMSVAQAAADAFNAAMAEHKEQAQ